MSYTRRAFLGTTGATAAATAAALSLPSIARAGSVANATSIVMPSRSNGGEPDLYDLAQHAVDAAISAGATYADVRLTLIRQEEYDSMMLPSGDNELYGVGVRVLANGYWGFMGSAVWTRDEMARLAQGAVEQAKANGAGSKRDIDLGAPPPKVNGEWRMPVKYDPFDIPKGEKIDFARELTNSFRQYERRVSASMGMYFHLQQKVFVSSLGSKYSQTTYVSGSSLSVGYSGQYSLQAETAMMNVPLLSAAGKGWEYFVDSDIFDRIGELVEQVEAMRYFKPTDPTRCDAVFSAQAMASLIDPTVGAATELDRALGYEANAGGTSYLNKPLEMIGTYKLGTPKLNVIADRSTPGALATVKWDDEAVEPDTFEIIRDGMLVDFQTTRESATWLSAYYKANNRPVRSHGCANAQSGLFITTQHSPNLQMLPGKEAVSFDNMVKDTKQGIAVLALNPLMDHQQLNGMAGGVIREIRDGKLGRYLQNAGILFRSPELWRNLVAVGGPGTEAWFGQGRRRGQPVQMSMHSVGAVPGKIANISLIDITRKA